jgi:hypothetical protein
MVRTICWLAIATLLSSIQSLAQTTDGLITGAITDPSGAAIAGASVEVANAGTGSIRRTTSGNDGTYLVPQLPPGVYKISVRQQGFATVERPDVPLEVNQSATINFTLNISGIAETVQVTGTPPILNATNATLNEVVNHQDVVDLPLNGRSFTQLALLTPGAAPMQDAQQGSFTVSLGSGGISPSVNGQRGEQNNYTMDGVLNNSLFTNIWAVGPPPDALQEFNVQSHITDAQFGISSGANINIATRSGSNSWHGSAWEFLRNTDLDSRTYPALVNLPYHQNQYGVYFGGPVMLPHYNGKNKTWFSGYWEGFRSGQTQSYFAGVPTAAERTGDFSALLGTPNVIYDPNTSRADPANSAAVVRDPFPNNTIPTNRINASAAPILSRYYPLPNLNVAASVLPNYQFSGTTNIDSDIMGVRIDHQFSVHDILFGRYNRSNANRSVPEATPGYTNTLNNYDRSIALGYTHIFSASTILNIRYGWLENLVQTTDTPAGAAFANSFNFNYGLTPSGLPMSYGPGLSISNGFAGVGQTLQDLGPFRGQDYHADLSRIVGHHTLGAGFMWYRLHANTTSYSNTIAYTQNATSQGATVGPSGYGPASFLLGPPDNISAYAGNLNEDMTNSWTAVYFQDQWKASKRLTITAGLRYDYAAPPNPHKTFSGLDWNTGVFNVSQPVPPLFPQATVPSTYFYPQRNGFEPRVGLAYQITSKTVFRSAFAIMDDHNQAWGQEAQNAKKSWPEASQATITLLNRGVPNVHMTSLPSLDQFLNPLQPVLSQTADAHQKISYTMEWNAGIQQQLTNTMVLTVNYVGSVGRHQYLQWNVNTAMFPGPGSLASRGERWPQYGGTYTWDSDPGIASYNALQAELKKTTSYGLTFIASYTFSKSLDEQSDPYGGTGIQNAYNLRNSYGPSDYDIPHLFVLSAVYALPVGNGKSLLSGSNRAVRTILANWNVGTIVTLHSGTPFICNAGGDIANVGGGTQRCNEIGDPYGGANFAQSPSSWINKASFTTIPYTFGPESRNDLRGPSYKNVDFDVYRGFRLHESLTLQLRGEFFNLFNRTNYLNPTNSFTSSAFGKILTAAPARQIQFAAKIVF